MFWKQTIESLENWKRKLMNDIMNVRNKYIDHDVEITKIKSDIDALMKSNENYKKCIEEIQKHEEAITAVVNSDRHDINAIINIIKKLQNKGKK